MSGNTGGAPGPIGGVAEAGIARAELYDTLAQLRDRLNYARRIDDRIEETRQNFARAQRENPVGFAVGVVAAAATVGVAVWGIASLVARRLRD